MKVCLDRPLPLLIKSQNKAKVLSFDLERGESRARFLGMVHLAEPAFYEQRNQELEEDPESTVLAEGIYDEQGACEGESSQETTALRKMYSILAEPFQGDPILQTRVFPRRQDVESCDLSMQELLQGLDLGRHGQVPGELMAMFSASIQAVGAVPSVPEEILPAARGLLKKQLADKLVGLGEAPEWLLKRIPGYKTIVVRRNHGVAQYLNDGVHGAQTVLVPWGVMHFPDMVRHLYPQGWNYVPGSAAYTPFMTMPTFLEQLKWTATTALYGVGKAVELGEWVYREGAKQLEALGDRKEKN